MSLQKNVFCLYSFSYAWNACPQQALSIHSSGCCGSAWQARLVCWKSRTRKQVYTKERDALPWVNLVVCSPSVLSMGEIIQWTWWFPFLIVKRNSHIIQIYKRFLKFEFKKESENLSWYWHDKWNDIDLKKNDGHDFFLILYIYISKKKKYWAKYYQMKLETKYIYIYIYIYIY